MIRTLPQLKKLVEKYPNVYFIKGTLTGTYRGFVFFVDCYEIFDINESVIKKLVDKEAIASFPVHRIIPEKLNSIK